MIQAKLSESEERVPHDFQNPDAGVQKLVDLLELGERTILYWHLARRRFHSDLFAYWYVIGWMVVLGVTLGTGEWWSEWWRPWRFVVALIAVYRLWDIGRWWLGLLVDRRHYKLLSRERNVLFLGLNLLELVFIGAILLRAAGAAGDTSDAWFGAFFLVTQLALPDGLTSSWDFAAVALTEIAALVLLLGGLTVLIAVVGQKLQEGEWSGPDDH